MPRFPRSLLAVSISTALLSPALYAATSEVTSVQETATLDQCLIDDSSEKNSDQLPIKVDAAHLEGVNGDKTVYKGDVVVTQGNKRIAADTITYDQNQNTVVAEGNVLFSDSQFQSKATKATTRLDSDQATIENSQYQFLCESGRGEAAVIHKQGKKFYRLEDGTLTSCPDGDNAWRLTATSIDIDQNEEEATLYNPTVEVLDVPVFYLPYLTIPIGDTRKTGFLYPSVSLDTKDGFGLSVPIYWNIAPNYDLQTDINYMEKRGVQLDATLRYLNEIGSGQIQSEYLPEDQRFKEKEQRWGVNWQHNSVFFEKWTLDVDYSKVSDIDYFSDLNSSIGSREDGQLLQSGQLSYRSNYWDTTLRVRNFQVLSEDNYPYRLMPQLEANYFAPRFYSHLNFNLASHISRFETDDKESPSATRIHLEPTLSLPLSTTWGNFIAEAKLYQTYYDQDLETLTDRGAYRERVKRSIPQFRVQTGVIFDSTDIISGYTQTLEPQVQFLYRPEKDQSAIYSGYDSTKLQLDYHGLFRSQRYSGVDYISPANQLSYGATSRFYDDNYKERMNISFGQILYLNDAYNDSVSSESSSSYSAWALETEFNYDDRYFYQGGFQYDTASSNVQLADSTLEYRYANGFNQLNYRYVSVDYITNNDVLDSSDFNSYTRNGINQLGFVTGYDVDNRWKLNGQYFYDLNEHVNLEWLAGVTYVSDCWYMGFSYSHQLYDWDEVGVGSPDYEQNFTFNFGIVGFGTSVAAGSDLTGLNSAGSSLGYGRPFYLNN